MRRRGSLSGRIALAGMAAAVALVAAEGAVRLGLAVLDRERSIVWDAELGWRPEPGARKRWLEDEEPYTIDVNSRGLRDRPRSLEPPPGVRRVLAVGDSFVFGAGGVETGDRVTEQLEARLAGVEVLNLGVPAFSLDQELLLLRREGRLYRPDLVLLFLYGNDFDGSFRPWSAAIGRRKGRLSYDAGSLVFHPLEPEPFDPVTRWSLLADAVRRAVSPPRPPADPGPPPPSGAERRPAFVALIGLFAEAARSAGGGLALVHVPHRDAAQTSELAELAGETAVRLDLPLLDLAELQSFAPRTRRSLYFERDIHWNAAGHRAAAAALAGFVRDALGSLN